MKAIWDTGHYLISKTFYNMLGDKLIIKWHGGFN